MADGDDRVPRPMRPGPAPRPLRILLVYSRPPLPMTRGDELTVAHLLEFLHARGHEVDFFTLESGPGLSTGHRAWLQSRCRRLVVERRARWRSAFDALAGLLAGRPLQIGWFRDRRQIRMIERALAAEPYDLAYAYYIRSAEALRRVRHDRPDGLVTFLALQLSQYLNTRRLAETSRSLAQRLLFRLESRLIRAYEARVWQDFTRTVRIGPKDLEAVRTACREEGVAPIDNHLFGPHGVDVEQFRPRSVALVEPGLVVLTGAMRYAPNAQAALWLASGIWPLVRRAVPTARLAIVGRDPPAAVRNLDGKAGITVTGTVADPADWMARAAVCVAPIQAASGLQNKLLEYLAMGKAVVATARANEGIGAAPGRDLVIADEPAAFAAAITDLLADPGRCRALGGAGRDFVLESWTWEGPFRMLEAGFYAAIEAAAATGPAPRARRRA
jgi:glycosyltransferase involved in cell wall biosynthesis